MWNVVTTPENLQFIGELPCVDTLIYTLHSCRQEKNLDGAQRVHARICQLGLECHYILGNHVVPMFVDCGGLHQATQVFNRLVHHTEHSWTSLIQGFSECEQWEVGVNLYHDMLAQEINPSPITFSVLFKACARPHSMIQGQELHSELTKKGFEKSPSVGNTLVDMYARCGLLEDAQNSFDHLPSRNVSSYSALATGYSDAGFAQEALACYMKMRGEGVSPNTVSYLCSIKACGSLGNLDQGYLVHVDIAVNGYESMPYVATALMGMYEKCGLLEQAEDVFKEMSDRDTFSWNLLLMGYADHGYDEKASRCWEQMRLEGVPPDGGAYVSILRTCIDVGALERGQQIHSECLCKGLESDPYIVSALIDMYMKFSCFSGAQKVFDGSFTQDVVLWTGLIAGYTEHGLGEQALAHYEDMCRNDVLPNPVTFACTLKACSSVGRKLDGQELHVQAVKMGLERDSLVCGSLVDFNVRLGSFVDAHYLFDLLSSWDTVFWNILISGYVEHGLYEEGLDCFSEMQQAGIPGAVSAFISALKACGVMGDCQTGRQVHVSIAKQGFESDTQVGNALVDMYARCGSLAEAEDGFRRLASRDVISWTALIQGYADKDLSYGAIKHFELMQEEGISPDAVTFSCILRAFSNIGALERGQSIHLEMVKRGLEKDTLAANDGKLGIVAEAQAAFGRVLAQDVGKSSTLKRGHAEGLSEEAMNRFRQMKLQGQSPNVSSWNSVMAGYGEYDEIDIICAEMLEHGTAPNEGILSNLLVSYGNTGATQSGGCLHMQGFGEIASEAAVEGKNLAVNLIDMYGKCGSMDDAQQVFDMIPKRDLVAWNALITGYARQGKSNTVFHLYSKLIEEELEPDEVTCLSFLCACQHAGLIDKGRKFFESMRREPAMEPTMKHYACTFDLLGRAGRLEEMVTMMQEMPFQPNLVTWHIIMSACQRNGDVELGRQAFECAESLGAYVCTSNVSVGAKELRTKGYGGD